MHQRREKISSLYTHSIPADYRDLMAKQKGVPVEGRPCCLTCYSFLTRNNPTRDPAGTVVTWVVRGPVAVTVATSCQTLLVAG